MRRSPAAGHEREIARLTRELQEALEQQTATTEVLSTISRAPGELNIVFESILANAVRLCRAKFGNLFLREGDGFRAGSMHGAPEAYAEAWRRDPLMSNLSTRPHIPLGRLARTMQTVHITDLAAERDPNDLDPRYVTLLESAAARTMLLVPMLKEKELIGAIVIYGQEVNPYSGKQIALVQNFAAQAVIAIENARLLNELRQRTDDLTESLEQQTATSDVLKIISSSPGELEPVFQAMLENATRICAANFGILWLSEDGGFRFVAQHGVPPLLVENRQREPFVRPGPGTGLGRVAKTKQLIHVADITTEQAYAQRDPLRVAYAELGGARTLVAVPMLQENELVGAITIFRQEVRPFTDKQIELVRISPPRPSSPSRARGCSASYASCCSSKRPHQISCASSVNRRPTCGPYSTASFLPQRGCSAATWCLCCFATALLFRTQPWLRRKVRDRISCPENFRSIRTPTFRRARSSTKKCCTYRIGR